VNNWVYLASQSPRRLQLLNQWGVRCEMLLPDELEDAEALEVVLPGEAPAAYVQRVTGLKLQAALARRERRGLAVGSVLCADTTVALGDRILGKPDSHADAHAMLRSLAGQWHAVMTAVALGDSPDTARVALSVSRVKFAELSDAQISTYVASEEPMGKAGAYAIQGRASLWIESIEGSYSGIMGLPALQTAQLMAQAGQPLY
jgi:septum formation protein